MKVTRIIARNLFLNLGQIVLKEMDTEILESVMHNFTALQKINDDFVKLSEELSKRLYGDPQTLDEESKQRYDKFISIIAKFERETNIEERINLLNSAKAFDSELFSLYEKQVSVLNGLLTKEIEVDLKFVDRSKFSEGIVKGNPDWPMFKINEVFTPIFVKEDSPETDFSELDTLLNN